jgi:hypothetical protein
VKSGKIGCICGYGEKQIYAAQSQHTLSALPLLVAPQTQWAKPLTSENHPVTACRPLIIGNRSPILILS